MKTLVVITGPTAVGKSKLCERLAMHFHIPIINADSRQIFKEMRIGTAAPSADTLAAIPHHFVGTLPLGSYYSAALFESQVLQLIGQQGELSLLSGGSMMYIDAVCKGIDDIPTIEDHIREQLKERLEKEGLEALCQQLETLDPEYYEFVDKKNPRRVVHGLEICLQTGKTYTSFRKQQTKERPFRIIKIGLNRPREELYERINRRVDEMMAEGLLDEVKRLLPYRHENALNTVGYKELFAYLDGTYSLEEAVERIKGNTRRYARKQLTWFKRDETMTWFHPDDEEAIIRFIQTQTSNQNNLTINKCLTVRHEESFHH